jgi:septal ring factor EnvC (AmiA/AmiB activator)
MPTDEDFRGLQQDIAELKERVAALAESEQSILRIFERHNTAIDSATASFALIGERFDAIIERIEHIEANREQLRKDVDSMSDEV